MAAKFNFPPGGKASDPFPGNQVGSGAKVLEQIPVTPAAPVEEVVFAKAPVVAKAEAAPVQSIVSQVNGNEDEEAPVAFGTKVSRVPITKFRGVKSFQKRIAVLDTTRIYAIKSHYDEILGSFRCFGTLCCEEGDPSVRYLIPILVYDTNREGEPVSGKFEIEYLAIGGSYYDSLITLHKGSPLDSIDLIVQCADEQYQKNTYIPVGPALWKTNDQFAREVAERYGKLRKFIPRSFSRSLGKTVVECEATYRRLKGVAAPANLNDSPGGTTFDLGSIM